MCLKRVGSLIRLLPAFLCSEYSLWSSYFFMLYLNAYPAAPCYLHVWSALQRQNAENLKQIFPEKEYRGLSLNFHIYVPVSELYIPTMGLLFCWRKYVDRFWEYINGWQTHECGNWGWGCAIPRKGIYKRTFRCSVHSAQALCINIQLIPNWWPSDMRCDHAKHILRVHSALSITPSKEFHPILIWSIGTRGGGGQCMHPEASI